MNTPSHLIINLLLAEGVAKDAPAVAVAAGAVLPDLPMALYFLHARLIRRRPQRRVWAQACSDPVGGSATDVLHSLPLLVCAGGLAAALHSFTWAWFFASMGVHALFDLFLHHDDAHRSFYPFSDWRFRSPVSYWDRRHHGQVAARIEVMAVLFACVILWSLRPQPWMHGLLVVTCGLYVLFPVFVWSLRVRRQGRDEHA